LFAKTGALAAGMNKFSCVSPFFARFKSMLDHYQAGRSKKFMMA